MHVPKTRLGCLKQMKIKEQQCKREGWEGVGGRGDGWGCREGKMEFRLEAQGWLCVCDYGDSKRCGIVAQFRLLAFTILSERKYSSRLLTMPHLPALFRRACRYPRPMQSILSQINCWVAFALAMMVMVKIDLRWIF